MVTERARLEAEREAIYADAGIEPITERADLSRAPNSMNSKLRYQLVHATDRRLAAEACMSVPDGTHVAFDTKPLKSKLQEEKYHACFNDIAKQCKHLNQCFDQEGWKRLLLDQFRSDMLNDPMCDEDIRKNLQHAVKMVPSLDGSSIVSIGLQSRRFKIKTASAFIEWLNAFGMENGVRFKIQE